MSLLGWNQKSLSVKYRLQWLHPPLKQLSLLYSAVLFLKKTVCTNSAGLIFELAAVTRHNSDDHVPFNLTVPAKASGHSRPGRRWSANLCRRRTNLVADWNNCLMPRDTDKRLLGLWDLELSAEGRGESDRVTHFPVKYIHSACKRDH